MFLEISFSSLSQLLDKSRLVSHSLRRHQHHSGFTSRCVTLCAAHALHQFSLSLSGQLCRGRALRGLASSVAANPAMAVLFTQDEAYVISRANQHMGAARANSFLKKLRAENDPMNPAQREVDVDAMMARARPWHGVARHDVAWHGKAGKAWRGVTCPGQHGMTWQA